MTLTFNERVDTVSPSSAKATLDRQQVTRIYPVPVSTAADVYNLPITVLGVTNYSPSSDGRLQRQLPLADSIYTSCFAESYDAIKGMGTPSQAQGNSQVEAPLINSQYAKYPYMDCSITFTSRNYALLPDANISVMTGKWWPDVNTDSTGAQQSYKYNNEFTRFCEVGPRQPVYDYIRQKMGLGMSFATATRAGGLPNPSGKPFGNEIATRIPNFRQSVIFHQIPLRFITSKNSFIASKNWENRVNQNAVQMPWNGVGDVQSPGTVLYETYSYTSYNMVTGRTWNVYGNGSNSERFCDIKLDFLVTSRTLPTSVTYTAPTNQNYVIGGFNLMNWHGDRNWWYATNTTVGGDNRPFLLSAPLELLLMTDPDSPQPGAIG